MSLISSVSPSLDYHHTYNFIKRYLHELEYTLNQFKSSQIKYFIKFYIACTLKNFFIVSKSNLQDFPIRYYHPGFFFYPINKTFFITMKMRIRAVSFNYEFCLEFLFAFSVLDWQGIKWNTFVNLNEKSDVILYS